MVSIYPCDGHGKRVPTKLEWLRLTLTSGSSKWTRPMRLCRDCLDQRVAKLGRYWAVISLEDDRPVAEMCAACQRPTPDHFERSSLFATAYRQGGRLDWFAYYCADCATDLRQAEELLADS